jgi:hypothetical protein
MVFGAPCRCGDNRGYWLVRVFGPREFFLFNVAQIYPIVNGLGAAVRWGCRGEGAGDCKKMESDEVKKLTSFSNIIFGL